MVYCEYRQESEPGTRKLRFVCYFFDRIFRMRNFSIEKVWRWRKVWIWMKKEKPLNDVENLFEVAKQGEKGACFFCEFFSWVWHKKICRYYQQTRLFFIYYFVVNMLTNFRQKWYIHCGGIMASSWCAQVQKGEASKLRPYGSVVGK